MKKTLTLTLFLLIAVAAFSQADTSKSVLEGLSTEKDSTSMMKDYMEQFTDLSTLQKAIAIRRFAQNQKLNDSIASFRKRTGINVFAKTYLKMSKFWAVAAEVIQYYDSTRPPYIMYDVKLVKLSDEQFNVIIESYTDGISLDHEDPALKKQEFKIPIANNTENMLVDSLIAKLNHVYKSKYEIYGQFVQFYKAHGQKYGFDRYNNKFPNMLTYYQQFAQGGSPFQPFKSVELNKTDKVQAFVDTTGIEIEFMTSLSPNAFRGQPAWGDTLKVEFNSIGATQGEPFDIQAYVVQKETENNEERLPVGQMKAIAYAKKEIEVKIINVNNNRLEDYGGTTALQDELNRIYQPAIVSFNVSSTVETMEADYTTDDEEGFYADPPDEIRYTLDMLEVMNTYQEKEIIKEGKIYVFLVDNPNKATQKGYAAFGQPAVFVFTDKHTNPEDLAHTIAHEIGHAAFILEHPNQITGGVKSQALMDYEGGEELWLAEWDVIHQGNLTGFWGSGKNYLGNEKLAPYPKNKGTYEAEKTKTKGEKIIYGGGRAVTIPYTQFWRWHFKTKSENSFERDVSNTGEWIRQEKYCKIHQVRTIAAAIYVLSDKMQEPKYSTSTLNYNKSIIGAFFHANDDLKTFVEAAQYCPAEIERSVNSMEVQTGRVEGTNFVFDVVSLIPPAAIFRGENAILKLILSLGNTKRIITGLKGLTVGALLFEQVNKTVIESTDDIIKYSFKEGEKIIITSGGRGIATLSQGELTLINFADEGGEVISRQVTSTFDDVGKETVEVFEIIQTKTGGLILREGASTTVSKLNLGKYIKKIGDFEVFKNGEVFYRTMSKNHYELLLNTRKLSATSETFMSPTLKYSEEYSGYLVKIQTKPGTIASLKSVGVSDGSKLVKDQFGELSQVLKGWNQSKVYFKKETKAVITSNQGQVNIGLGKGTGIDIFNNNIVDFELIKIIK